MEFLRKLEEQSPVYAEQYRPLIGRFAPIGGEHSEMNNKYETGRFFSNVYEFYMYAICLGIRHNYPVPIASGTKKRIFLAIRDWKPTELVKFLIMSVLVKSDIDFIALEDMEDDAIKSEISKLKHLLEDYANGGFDIISAKEKEDPYFFQQEYCFLKLIKK